MKHPIPDSALDDRLGFVGTAGSGKTYNSGGRVERLLEQRSRCVIPDPLGVWWGLRLMADGKTASPYDVVIFGGPHGDLPLTEHAGALIGEAVAGMKESCILDLSELGTKAAERRFMNAFLAAFYKHANGEPVHVIFDEADMWAPQRLMEKEGEAAKLLGMMETIVRRGRVKGFIPWLITQRPAVLSKNVLSQVDGLVAFKLTSSQDRDAIGDWVEGQADKAQWKQIWSSLPTMERGQGVVWMPSRSILQTVSFPAKTTFDSSRTPKRGERKQYGAALKPLDVGKLKDRLATVEAETKANDPKALKAEIVKLKSELAAKAAPAGIHPQAVAQAVADAEQRGYRSGVEATVGKLRPFVTETARRLKHQSEIISSLNMSQVRDDMFVDAFNEVVSEITKSQSGSPAAVREHSAATTPMSAPRPSPRSAPIPSPKASGDGTLSGPEQSIADAIHWWNVFGLSEPTHHQVAFIANYVPGSGTWNRYLSSLRSSGIIEPKGPLVLTAEGRRLVNPPAESPSITALQTAVLTKIDAPLRKILEPLLAVYPHGLSHEDLAAKANYVPGSGTWNRYLSSLRSLDLIERRGELKAQAWLFP